MDTRNTENIDQLQWRPSDVAACTSGDFGKFCYSITNNLPATRGPWNSAGYFVASKAAKKTAINTFNAEYTVHQQGRRGNHRPQRYYTCFICPDAYLSLFSAHSRWISRHNPGVERSIFRAPTLLQGHLTLPYLKSSD